MFIPFVTPTTDFEQQIIYLLSESKSPTYKLIFYIQYQHNVAYWSKLLVAMELLKPFKAGYLHTVYVTSSNEWTVEVAPPYSRNMALKH